VSNHPAPAGPDRLQVEIWSDLVCPWCYVGRARFATALAAFADGASVDVTYRAFELDPNAPRGGTVTVAEMLAAKYGGQSEAIRAGEQRLVAMAAELGLGYRVDRLHGNTLDAHRLVQLGIERGVGEDLVSRLFQANFADGRSIFDQASLTEIGTEAGLDPAEAAAVVASATFTDEVRADERTAAEIGISGVPFYVFDRAYGVSGAQSTDTFSAVLDQVWRERHAAPTAAASVVSELDA
jgi:predicted DsbA family dithiol-disulfide isomerase